MSFNIILMRNISDPRTMGKILTWNKNQAGGGPDSYGEVRSCRPTEEVDVLRPTFEIDYSERTVKSNYNYIWCDLFNRYYFIDDMEIQIGKKIIIHCSVDVLETYNFEIRQCLGTITRCGGLFKPTEIPDEKLPINPNEKTMLSKTFLGGDVTFGKTEGEYTTIVQIAQKSN